MRLALRRLVRFKGSTLASVAILALGIGAATAVFSVADVFVFQPMFPEQETLYAFWPELPNGNRVEISYPEFLDWQRELEGFSDLAVMWSSNLKRVYRRDAELDAVSFRWVSDSFFDTLGMLPLLGRTFRTDDTEPGAECVAVASYGFWQSRLGRRADALGEVLGGEAPCTVVGVMPRGFAFPQGVDLWLPLVRDGEVMNRGLGVLWGIGRIAGGYEPERARAELDALNRRLDEEHFGTTKPVTMKIRPILDEHLGAATSPALLALFAGVVLMFLIACANVAGIGVTRALSRSDELWIQRALGASRGALLGELVLESALIATAGAALGVASAAATMKLLPWLDPPYLPDVARIEIGTRVLGFVVLSAFAATTLPGLSAAWSVHRSRRGRVRDGLVAGQIVLAVVLLTGAGLCLRSFAELRKIELGYERENVLSAIVLLPPSGYPELEDRRTAVREIVERARALPGVSSAATVLLRPFEAGLVGWGSYLLLEGQVDSDSFTRNPEVNYEAVTPGYFETMGIRLLEGRNFTELDTDRSPPVAIVTRELAERLWPGEQAVGKRLRSSYGSRMRGDDGELRFQTVVGVVESATYRGLLTSYFDLYVPYRQSNPQPNQIVLRTAVAPESLAPLLRAEIRALDPAIALDGVTTLEAIVEEQFRPWRFNARLFSFLGAAATLLAAVGLFALVAIGVSERTREIGIRSAIGATPLDLLLAFVRRGLAVASVGVAIGLAASFVLARAFASVLYGVGPSDPTALVSVAAVLLATALGASFVPARRAARIAPAEALRDSRQ